MTRALQVDNRKVLKLLLSQLVCPRDAFLNANVKQAQMTKKFVRMIGVEPGLGIGRRALPASSHSHNKRHGRCGFVSNVEARTFQKQVRSHIIAIERCQFYAFY